MGTQKITARRTTGPGLKEVETVDASAGAGSSGAVVSLDDTGRIDQSMMPAGVGTDQFSLPASEALTAGDFVNAWDDAGTMKVRRADNSNGREADGYVLAGVVSGATADVEFSDQNSQLSGLTVGADYYLGTVGGVTTTQPSATGELVQHLGKALSATSIQVRLSDPIELA